MVILTVTYRVETKMTFSIFAKMQAIYYLQYLTERTVLYAEDQLIELMA
jgi:hypothetical protein